MTYNSKAEVSHRLTARTSSISRPNSNQM